MNYGEKFICTRREWIIVTRKCSAPRPFFRCGLWMFEKASEWDWKWFGANEEIKRVKGCDSRFLRQRRFESDLVDLFMVWHHWALKRATPLRIHLCIPSFIYLFIRIYWANIYFHSISRIRFYWAHFIATIKTVIHTFAQLHIHLGMFCHVFVVVTICTPKRSTRNT